MFGAAVRAQNMQAPPAGYNGMAMQAPPAGFNGMAMKGQEALSNLNQAKQAAKDSAMQAAQGLANVGMDAVGGLADSAWGATKGVAGTVGNIANAVGDKVNDAYRDIQRTKQIVNTARDATRSYIGTSLKNAPANIAREVKDVASGLVGTWDTATEVAGAVGNFAQSTIPVPPANKILDPSAWKNTYQNYGSQLMSQYGALSDSLEAVAEGIEAKYCTPALFIPSFKEPAQFIGPSFAVTFTTGECSLSDKYDPEHPKVKKYLDCTGPSIEYVKTPATFTAKYKTSPEFISKECPITKEFGEEVIKVLYVFDGQTYPNITRLTSEVTDQMRTIMGGLTAGPKAIASQLQSFVSSVPALPGFGGSLPAMNFNGGMKAPSAGMGMNTPAGNKYSDYGVNMDAMKAVPQS